jgi:hypothetical protein
MDLRKKSTNADYLLQNNQLLLAAYKIEKEILSFNKLFTCVNRASAFNYNPSPEIEP